MILSCMGVARNDFAHAFAYLDDQELYTKKSIISSLILEIFGKKIFFVIVFIRLRTFVKYYHKTNNSNLQDVQFKRNEFLMKNVQYVIQLQMTLQLSKYIFIIIKAYNEKKVY